jgi:hypothetical protein
MGCFTNTVINLIATACRANGDIARMISNDTAGVCR